MTGGVTDGVGTDFGRDGVLIVRGLVPRSELPDRPVRSTAPSDGRAQDLWRTDPRVRALARHPAVLTLVDELLGRPAIPFQTLNFDRGTEQPLHSDTLHFDSVPTGSMCGAWVALETVGPDQGPLRIVPGSHLLDHIGPDDVRGPDGRIDMARYEAAVAERLAGLPTVDVTAEPGDVVIWDARLAHGGAPVVDPTSTRRSQVTHYFGAGCIYVTPLHSRPSEGRYRLRDPLVDIATGRWVRPTVDGRRARLVHERGGLSRLAGDEPIGAVDRLASAVRSGARLTRAIATRARPARRS